MEQNNNLNQEIYFHFKELGIILYGEYILKNYQNNENYMNELLTKYYIFLTNENNIPSKINHKVCYYYFKDEQCDSDENNEIIESILSKINYDLKINYFNFILICNLIHYYNRFFEHIDSKETSFLLYQLKKFSNLIINSEQHLNDEDDSIIMIYLFFYYYSILLYR